MLIAYAPQEDDNMHDKIGFWNNLEKDIITAVDDNCFVLIQMDANAKVGSEVVKGDPNEMSGNGKLLLELLKRQNLYLLNGSENCKGVITRYRKTVNGEEKAVLDYVIVCGGLFSHFIKMFIDEERMHTLTKYASTKGVRKNRVESDHNPIYCEFDIKHSHRKIKKDWRFLYNFKQIENQNEFKILVDRSSKLTEIFEKEGTLEQKSQKFLKELDKLFSKSFSKIRVTNKATKDPIQESMEVKMNLKITLKNEINESMKKFVRKKLEDIEDVLEEYTGEENREKWRST